MSKEIKNFSLLKGIVFVIPFVLGAQSYAAIYDGGTYSAKKVHEEVDVKPLGPNLATAVAGVDGHSLSAAPLGKPFYIIGEDQKCYRGNFSKSKETTALIVYYSSPVSTEHCVYQQSFTPKPSGYSISVKEGGSCIPSHVDVAEETYDWVYKADGPAVAFSTCFGEATSYGDNIDRKHKGEDVAAEKPKAVKPDVEVIKTAPTILEVSEPKAPQPAPQAVPQAAAAVVPPRAPSSIEEPYTLQIASFTSTEEADTAISSLKEKGIDAFAIQGKVAGSTRFRVCSGHFATSKMARNSLGELAQKAGSKDAFVQLIPKDSAQSGATTLK